LAAGHFACCRAVVWRTLYGAFDNTVDRVALLFQTLQNDYAEEFHHCQCCHRLDIIIHFQVTIALDDGFLRENGNLFCK
jgi:hypothetical protein